MLTAATIGCLNIKKGVIIILVTTTNKEKAMPIGRAVNIWYSTSQELGRNLHYHINLRGS
jgi:hypothetical protein